MSEREPMESKSLSTADLAAAANRGGNESTADLERHIDDREVERARATSGPADVNAERHAAPLLASNVADELRSRWTDIQAGFVDEPRRAVEEADQLVAQTMKRLAESFAEERARLEGQWDRGDDVSTEDLRIALRRYRAFFGRLLAA